MDEDKNYFEDEINMREEYDDEDRKRKNTSSTLLIIFLILVSIGLGGYILYYLYVPNFRTMPFFEHFRNLDRNDIHIVIGDSLEDSGVVEYSPPIKINDHVYIPADFIRMHIDEYIFWDNDASKLIITNLREVKIFDIDRNEFLLNNRPQSLRYPIIRQGGMAYMNMNLVMELYFVELSYDNETRLLVMDYRMLKGT